MPDSDSNDINVDHFLEKGIEFFSFYTHKHSPVFAVKASVVSLRESLDKSNAIIVESNKLAAENSKASANLARTLNRLTLFGVIVGGLNIVVQLISIFAQHPK